MTKKTARIKIVADGKVQYVDVDVTVDDPPVKSTPTSRATVPTTSPTPARKSPLGCLLVAILILGIMVLLAGIFSPATSSSPYSKEYSDYLTELPVTNEYLEPIRTQAADKALSAISVTVTNNHCEGSDCADYTIRVENGAFYERWQPTFYFQSGKTSLGYCDYSGNGASCFLSKNGLDLNSDPATKVCFEIEIGTHTGQDTTQFCKDIPPS